MRIHIENQPQRSHSASFGPSLSLRSAREGGESDEHTHFSVCVLTQLWILHRVQPR